jgi:hypothetical protein
MSADERELVESERIILSASTRALTQEEAARVNRTLLWSYERVREMAAADGIELPPHRSPTDNDTTSNVPSLSGDVSSGSLVHGTLSSGGAGTVEHSAIVPGHPVPWILAHGGFPSQEYRQVVERVDTVELTGVDKTHEDVADPSADQCTVEERVLPM